MSATKIEFVITEKNEVLLRPITKKVDDVFGLLHQAGKKPASIEDMDAAIKQKIRERFL
jgi:antitoxin PrlF